MKTLSRKLCATAAFAALALGFSNPAQAFDNVGWDWGLEMTGTYNTTLELELDLVPAGLIVMEKTQLQIGDVTAESKIKDIKNKPASEGGTVDIDETFVFNTMTDDSEDPSLVTPAGPVTSGDLDGNLVSGTMDEGSDELELTFNVAGQVFVPAGGELDGIDLPSVESTATAVGNNQSITTTTALQLHDAQFLIGGFGEEEEEEDIFAPSALSTNGVEDPELNGNFHTDMMVAMISGGLEGLVEPATISADSKVKDIYNASVDSSATAVGNNMDVNLNAITNADALMLADIHQASYADITATSKIKDVDVFNYANLGVLEGPLVSSTATAIGNNFSIDLTEPDPDL